MSPNLDRQARFILHSSGASYWGAVHQAPLICRLPILTVATCVACIVIFFANDAHGWSYGRSNEGPWWSCLAAMISHVDQEHLWSNVAFLAIAGCFLEITEGVPHVACVLFGGGCIGAALHGVADPDTRVRGTSGAIYAVFFSQLSLLALNWAEMPARVLRLCVLLILIVVDVAALIFWRSDNVSYEGHLFGALAGVSIALVLGRNVRLRRFEIAFTWLGVLGYAALVATAFAGGQTKAAALAAGVLPLLGVAATWITRCSLRAPDPVPSPTVPEGDCDRGGFVVRM